MQNNRKSIKAVFLVSRSHKEIMHLAQRHMQRLFLSKSVCRSDKVYSKTPITSPELAGHEYFQNQS